MSRIIWLNAALTVVLAVVVGVLLYREVTRPQLRIGRVDVSHVYKVKTEQLFAKASSKNDKERATAVGDVDVFFKEIEVVLAELPAECKCLVLTSAGLVNRNGQQVIDLTPRVKQRLGLGT